MLLGLAAGGPGLAQNFTTAAEVKPILAATKGSWVAIREYEGNDLLYFTHLESWRCGLSEIRFSVNSGAAAKVWETEPCHEGTAQPNAMTLEGHLPYVVLPLGMVQSVSVVVVFDDGTEDRADLERAAVLIP
ncbi:hypothetical protein GEU84_006485 [Fertoebacter nigrum]|uniref:Uncharacterized protein n=1 Tax=Fertoeibacter niger TaxID=2656921 RepID=A0A8X8GZD0_9RHOB|nr:hypothetical protein [Fertoeibacter niger]